MSILKLKFVMEYHVQGEMYMDKLLYPVSEVAKMLYVNRNRVYKLVYDGELGYVKLGVIKIPAVELQKYIEKNTKRKKLQNNS